MGNLYHQPLKEGYLYWQQIKLWECWPTCPLCCLFLLLRTIQSGEIYLICFYSFIKGTRKYYNRKIAWRALLKQLLFTEFLFCRFYFLRCLKPFFLREATFLDGFFYCCFILYLLWVSSPYWKEIAHFYIFNSLFSRRNIKYLLLNQILSFNE